MVKVPIVSDLTAEDMSTGPAYDSRCIYLSLPLSSLDDDEEDYFTSAKTNKTAANASRTSSPSPSIESVSGQDE